jgi:hypothetical protein
LIQGRSRRERSFLWDALVGFVLGSAVVIALKALTPLSGDSGLEAVMGWALAPVLVGSAAGAPVGVFVASGFGWHPRWVCATATGAALSLGATLLFSGLVR